MKPTRSLPADYLLALLGPKDKPVVDSTHWKAGLAGAAVVEAVISGTLRLTGPDEPGVKAGRLVRTSLVPPAGEVWADVLARSEGRKPKDAVARIGGGSTVRDRAGALRDAIAADLQREEVVSREDRAVLGLFPRPRITVIDQAARDEVLARVAAALQPEAELDEHEGALASLLYASDALTRLFPAVDRGWLKERGKAVSKGSWGSTAVSKAIADVNAAVVAGVVAATVATTAATS